MAPLKAIYHSLSHLVAQPNAVSNLSATPLVRPGDPVVVTGVFVDGNGNSVSVPQSYIMVVEDLGTVKLNESLGVNVNRFTKTIDTTGFRGGGYTITVSDRPVTAPLHQQVHHLQQL